MRFYFDMDGVLADFQGTLERRGMPYAPLGCDDPDREDAMWDAIRQDGHFYRNLDPVPGSIELFKKLSEKHRCEILTAVPKPRRGIDAAEADKREWVGDRLGPDVDVNVCMREDKKLYCKGPDCVLVDDCEKNIREWEASGGTGVLFTTADAFRIPDPARIRTARAAMAAARLNTDAIQQDAERRQIEL